MNYYMFLETKEYPLFEGDIRLRFPDMGSTFVLPDGYVEVIVTDPPAIDDSTQRLILGAPIYKDGAWCTTWSIAQLTQEQIDAQQPIKIPPPGK